MEPDLTLAQKDSYLRSCSGEVLHTFIQPFGKEKVPHLILSQTVLFPEGGGQPGDTGHIVTENNNNSFNVLHSFRDEKGLVVHAIAVKKGEKPPEKGDKVTVNVDWERRWDHMVQHSTQHLVSAIAEKEPFHWKTSSWGLGDQHSFIEFEAEELKPELVVLLEQRVNEAIIQGHTVTWRVAEAVNKEVNNSSGKVPLRVVSMIGTDNPCCGTHVATTAHLQAFVILDTEQRHKGMRCIVFAAGGRIQRIAREGFQRDRGLTKALNVGPERFAESVSGLQADLRLAQRAARDLRDALADETAASLARDLSSKLCFFDTVGAGSGLDLLQGVADRLSRACPDKLFVGVARTEATEKNAVFVVQGPEKAVAECGKLVAEALGGKGGGRAGKFQGKTATWSQAGLQTAREKANEVSAAL